MSKLFDRNDGHIISVSKFNKAHRDSEWREHYQMYIRLKHMYDDYEVFMWTHENMKTSIKPFYKSFMKNIKDMIEMERSLLQDREEKLEGGCNV